MRRRSAPLSALALLVVTSGVAANGCQPPAAPPPEPPGCLLDSAGPPEESAYVLDRAANEVVVINPRDCELTKRIPVGVDPVAANATASGSHVFVANRGSNTVSIIETVSKKVIKTLDVGEQPDALRFNTRHDILWVHNAGSGTFSLIDIREQEVVGTIDVGPGAHRMAMNERYPYKAYLSDAAAGTVEVIDTSDYASVATIPVGASPRALEFSAQSEKVYVCSGTDAPGIDVIPTEGAAADLVTKRIALEAPCHEIAFDRTERWGFALVPDRDEVVIIDADTDEIAATVAVGTRPDKVVFPKDCAVIANGLSPDVSIIHAESFEEIDRIETGAGLSSPEGDRSLRDSLDGHHVYIPNPGAGTVTILDSATREVRGTVHVGGQPSVVVVAGPSGGSCC